MGEVKDGRRRRRQSVIYFARRQLEGFRRNELLELVCQKCQETFAVKSGLDACAFCPDCKDDVMDMLAEAVVNAAKPRRAR